MCGKKWLDILSYHCVLICVSEKFNVLSCSCDFSVCLKVNRKDFQEGPDSEASFEGNRYIFITTCQTMRTLISVTMIFNAEAKINWYNDAVLRKIFLKKEKKTLFLCVKCLNLLMCYLKNDHQRAI